MPGEVLQRDRRSRRPVVVEVPGSENPGASGIARPHRRLSADEPPVVLERDEDVPDRRRDDVVVPSHAVEQQQQIDLHPVDPQCSRQRHCRPAAQALAVDHQPGATVLGGRDAAVAVAVERVENPRPGESRPPVLERLGEHPRRAAHLQGELADALAPLVPGVEAAEQPHEEAALGGERARRAQVGGPHPAGQRRHEEGDEGRDRDAPEGPHPSKMCRSRADRRAGERLDGVSAGC